jgi:uncharacterized membrane protein YgaE (UPF0421/DUF939 family)
VRRRLRRARSELWPILQTTLAAGAAWTLASTIHSQPFFAPVSAVISLGVARGRRTVRAIELTVGVAVGIAVADLIVHALGGGTLVLMLVVTLSMIAALLLGAGTLLVNQAAISAILVVATLKPGQGPSPSRLLDALIGGAIALLVGQVLFPRDPVRAMAKAARPVVSDLAVALTATAEALRDGDEARARRALEIARETDGDLAGFFDAVALARETFVLRRPGRRTRERLPLYADAAQQMDYAVRNTRVLARRPERDPARLWRAARAGRRDRPSGRRGPRARSPARGSARRIGHAPAGARGGGEGDLRPRPGCRALDERDHRPDPLDGHRSAPRLGPVRRGGAQRAGRGRRARGRRWLAAYRGRERR